VSGDTRRSNVLLSLAVALIGLVVIAGVLGLMALLAPV
jgi:hypothetical protein